MEIRQCVGMPFKTHIYLDVREEGVELSVCDNMLIKAGHHPELPPPGESMAGASLTPDDYDRGVNIRFWQNRQIDLIVALDADQALDFVGELISALLTAHVGVAGGSESDPDEIDSVTEQITHLIQDAAALIASRS